MRLKKVVDKFSSMVYKNTWRKFKRASGARRKRLKKGQDKNMQNLQIFNPKSLTSVPGAVVMGTSSAKNQAAVSVKCLGRIPKVTFGFPTAAAVRPGTFVDRQRRKTEANRFAVEALLNRVEKDLGFKVKIVSDDRGAAAGGFVKLIVGYGMEVVISTLPVQTTIGEQTSTSYYVWEVSINGAGSVRPRAGRGLCDMDKCVRFIRREYNGF